MLQVRRLTVRKAAEVTAHVADALNYAHSLKVVHQLDKGDITSNKNGRQEAFGNPVNRFVL